MKSLLRTEKQRKADLTRSSAAVIRSAMAEQGIESLCKGAEVVGIPRNTFYGRMKRGGWTQAELVGIVETLHMSATQAVRLLGVKV